MWLSRRFFGFRSSGFAAARRAGLRLTLLLPALLLPALSGGAARAADPTDPEWPCIQRKVPHLSIGQMWAAPPIDDAALNGWRDQPEVKALAPALAVRRTEMTEAESLIDAFAEKAGDAKAERLSILFAGVFSLIDRERSSIIAGIGRYAKKQSELSERIEARRAELETLRAAENPDNDALDKIDELQDALDWDTRIYKDRTQSLRYVCETPVILEKRAFALARAMQAHLD